MRAAGIHTVQSPADIGRNGRSRVMGKIEGEVRIQGSSEKRRQEGSGQIEAPQEISSKKPGGIFWQSNARLQSSSRMQ
jgi:hypothetical protein